MILENLELKKINENINNNYLKEIEKNNLMKNEKNKLNEEHTFIYNKCLSEKNDYANK